MATTGNFHFIDTNVAGKRSQQFQKLFEKDISSFKGNIHSENMKKNSDKRKSKLF